MIKGKTDPLIVLKHIPSAYQLVQIRHFIYRFKQANPHAKKWDVIRAVQNEFNNKIIKKLVPSHFRARKHLNRKPV